MYSRKKQTKSGGAFTHMVEVGEGVVNGGIYEIQEQKIGSG